MISNSCGDLQNLNATFDDDGDPPFTCGTDESFAIFGTVKPLGALSSFDGESILGGWILEISDNASSDGGELIDFSLDICVEGAFRPDADNDGVFDDGDDQCLGTPEGAEVNTSGCQIFRLPADNFSVNVQSESCRDNNDGIITIDPALKLDYEITIVGGGQDITDTFTTDYSLEQLSSGTYEICITGSGTDIIYEPYCFVVNLTQPEALSVLSSFTDNGSRLSLNLSGSETYIVELNGGVLTQTQSPEINLDLKAGKNVLKVYTGLECQGGVFEESYYFDSGSSVWPNPFSLSTQLHLNGTDEDVEVRIFHLNGQLISKRTYSSIPNDQHEIDFAGLPSGGVYLIKVNGGVDVDETFKVIKK